MKKSIFNIEVDDGSFLIIYNTLSCSMIRIAKDEWYNFTCINSIGQLSLCEMGFLINEKIDEFSLWKKYTDIIYKKRNSQTYVIAPTLKCNANCWYCFENSSKKFSMSDKRIGDVIDEINTASINPIRIIWFGGEPTLALDEIEQILNGIKKTQDDGSKIITNGFLLDSIRLKKLRELNIKYIQITLDALFSEYDNCKRYNVCNGAFEKVVSNIKEALELGFQVAIRVNVNPMKKSNAVDTINYCIDLFSFYPNFNIYAAPLDFGEGVSLKEQAEAWFYCLQLIWTNQKYKKKYKNLQAKYRLNYNIKGCELTNGVKVIGPDRNYLCHRELGQVEDIKIGDFYLLDCHECPILPICNGGCHINRIKYGAEFGCSFMKYIVDKVVKLYYNELKGD